MNLDRYFLARQIQPSSCGPSKLSVAWLPMKHMQIRCGPFIPMILNWRYSMPVRVMAWWPKLRFQDATRWIMKVNALVFSKRNRVCQRQVYWIRVTWSITDDELFLQIVVLQDKYIWTATSSSDINRWVSAHTRVHVDEIIILILLYPCSFRSLHGNLDKL